MSCQHDLVFVVCHLVAMVSTCINPLFYGFFKKFPEGPGVAYSLLLVL